MGFIEETDQLMLDWDKIGSISAENIGGKLMFTVKLLRSVAD